MTDLLSKDPPASVLLMILVHGPQFGNLCVTVCELSSCIMTKWEDKDLTLERKIILMGRVCDMKEMNRKHEDLIMLSVCY